MKKGFIFITVIIFIIVSVCILAFLPLDFSQEYRNAPNVENIIFQSNRQRDKFYIRCFWGLRKTKTPMDFESYQSDVTIKNLLGNIVDERNQIRQAVVSPDGNYILYCEIQSGYKKTGLTDDEYCYYRVYNTKTSEIVTIYQGYQEWYNLGYR